MKTDYPRLKAALDNSIWAIEPGKLNALLESLDYVPPGAELEKPEAIRGLEMKTSGAIAVLPLHGIVTQRSSWLSWLFGGISTDKFGEVFDSVVEDKRISAIIIDVDSPGGSVYGVQELSRRIFNARSKKPITAIVNSVMASAAYWIASAAGTVVITPSGQAGSIGVVAVHFEASKYDEKEGFTYTVIKAGEHKAEDNSYEPLTEEARDYIQGEVDGYYKSFVADVARNRGVSEEFVEKKFGQGRMQSAKDAKASRLVDGIATFDEVINKLSKQLNQKKARQSAQALRKKKLAKNINNRTARLREARNTKTKAISKQ